MSDLVRLEVEDGIGTIRIDRPPMNALNGEVQQGLLDASREAAERKDVAAVVVYGGEKVFAAGADIKEMATMSYTDMVDRSARLQDFTSSSRRDLDEFFSNQPLRLDGNDGIIVDLQPRGQMHYNASLVILQRYVRDPAHLHAADGHRRAGPEATAVGKIRFEFVA